MALQYIVYIWNANGLAPHYQEIKQSVIHNNIEAFRYTLHTVPGNRMIERKEK